MLKVATVAIFNTQKVATHMVISQLGNFTIECIDCPAEAEPK